MQNTRTTESPHATSTAEDLQQDDDGPSGSRPRRRRTALACNACRVRKSRCNGRRPRCTLCERMGFECVYEMPGSSANLIVSKDIIAGLESRLEALENKVRQHNEQLEAGGTGAADRCATPTSLQSYLASEPTDPPAGTVVVSVLNQEPDLQTDANETDGMAISLVDDDDYGYFGPSSNISLMRSISRAMAHKGYVPDISGPSPIARADYHTRTKSAMSEQQQRTSVSADSASRVDFINPNYLPPNDETQALISQYFANTGMLFPYIHEPSFIETYQQLRQRQFRTQVRRTWLGLLNMILAMATCTAGRGHVDPHSSSAFTKSDAFYRRAQELCKTQMLRGTTLETGKFHFPLGTALTPTSPISSPHEPIPPRHTEGYPNVEYPRFSCQSSSLDWFTLQDSLEQIASSPAGDESLSMTYGRPSAIPEDYIKIDLPTPIAVDSGGGVGVAFYTATILGDINRHVPHLERCRLVLTLRYLNTQSLLLRPLLTEMLKDGCEDCQGQEIPKEVQESLIQECVQLAEEIIAIIHSVLTHEDLGNEFLGAWWFTTYYTFNAALVVFGSLLIPSNELDMKIGNMAYAERVRETLQKGTDALVRLDPGNTLVDRGVAYIRQLLRLVEEWIACLTTANHGSPMNRDLVDNGALAEAANSDLSPGISLFQNGTEFTDEIELGPFVHNEFQRWFAATPWRNE
ncbi:hypothetical protein ACJZ2D_014824 [Fusarium nematophilum]